MRRVLLTAGIILAAAVVRGQQLPVYSQYLFNKFLINPSVAGNDGYTSFSLTAREQWIGYEGAPQTYSFSAQTRLLKKAYSIKNSKGRKQVFRPKSDGRVGLGGLVFSDRNGLAIRTGFQASYAYHMWVQNATQVSMGLAFTGYHFRIDAEQVNFEDPAEPWLNNDFRKGVFIPDAAFGISVLNPRYSVGFSADQLFGAALKLGSEAYEKFKMSRHFYVFGSYTLPINNNTELQPSFLVKTSDQLKPQADIGLTYIYNNSFWGGLTYRTGSAVIANVGVKVEKFFFGYSFDFTLQEIQRITYGSHEVTLALKFGDSARKYRWLDRY
jgi:type IX secretion system PorP/SprF family membrane protein